MISDTIAFLKERGAYCPPPRQLTQVVEQFPDEYKMFLEYVDGFQWEGLIFHGIYEIGDLLTDTQRIIGRTNDGLVFVYDVSNRTFAAVDRSSYDVFFENESFLLFLKYIVNEKWLDLQELPTQG